MLNGIYNGNIVNNTLVTGNYLFAAYPFNGGVEFRKSTMRGLQVRLLSFRAQRPLLHRRAMR